MRRYYYNRLRWLRSVDIWRNQFTPPLTRHQSLQLLETGFRIKQDSTRDHIYLNDYVLSEIHLVEALYGASAQFWYDPLGFTAP